jgi:hypothetical protein
MCTFTCHPLPCCCSPQICGDVDRLFFLKWSPFRHRGGEARIFWEGEGVRICVTPNTPPFPKNPCRLDPGRSARPPHWRCCWALAAMAALSTEEAHAAALSPPGCQRPGARALLRVPLPLPQRHNCGCGPAARRCTTNNSSHFGAAPPPHRDPSQRQPQRHQQPPTAWSRWR